MDVLAHLVIGLFIAFLASLPLGPVNLSVIQASINRGRRVALRIAAGASMAELLYAAVAVLGVNVISEYETVISAIMLLSVPVLIGLGVHALLKGRYIHPEQPDALEVDDRGVPLKKDPPPPRQIKQLRGSFWLGASMNLLNPILIPFWLGVISWLRGNMIFGGSMRLVASFLGGVAAGTFLLLATMATIGANRRNWLSPRRIHQVNRVIGVMFLCFAAYTALEVARRYHWVNI